MIKFFRKIRQNLLSEGKTGKYFKYAIGEIILVVIGILIALQINNWNEHRKELEGQQVLFKQLLSDSMTDSVFFRNRLEGIEVVRSSVIAIRSLEEDADFDISKISTNGTGSVLPYAGVRNESNVFNNYNDVYGKILNTEVKDKLRSLRARYGYVITSYEIMNNTLLEISNQVQPKYYKEFRQNVQDSSRTTLIKIYSDPYLRSKVDRVLARLRQSTARTNEFLSANRELLATLRKNLKDDD